MQVRHPYALASAVMPLLVGAANALPATPDASKFTASASHALELGAVVGAVGLAMTGRMSGKGAAKVAAISGATWVAGTAAHAWHERRADEALLRPNAGTPSPTPPVGHIDPTLPAGAKDMQLGHSFFLGTTTSATQVEGGGIDNDVTRWATTHDGWAAHNPGLDHYNRLEEDYTHLAENGHNAHSFTIDWARIEPREGEFDEAAIEHYRTEIETCRAKGMEPIVTLMQYGLPPWLADKGGVLNPRAPELFARFSHRMAEEYGDDVTYWMTMNEPNTLAAAGYLAGVWGPGQTSVRAMSDALEGQLRMHAAAATELHAVAKEHHRATKVGIAFIDDKMYPAQSWNPLDQAASRAYDYVGNQWFLNALESGRASWPVGSGDVIKGLKGSVDFMGLNFYGRGWGHFTTSGKGREGSPIEERPNPDLDPGAPTPAFDEEGLYERTMAMWNRFHVPVLINESGVDIAGPDAENVRGRAIVDSLAALRHAKDDGAKVLGYMHWTDWDSPEWQDGWTQHYGLFGFDPATGRRWDKPAANTFEVVARRHAIPAEWLSADNREDPSRRDVHAAHERRVAEQGR